MAEDNKVWFHSSGFPEIKLSWVGAVGGTGLTEGIQTGFLTVTATFAKAGHGICQVIAEFIRSGTVIRFDIQTSRVLFILWRTHHPTMPWPSLSSGGAFTVLCLSSSQCSSQRVS